MSLREGWFLPLTHIKYTTYALAKVKAGMTDTFTIACWLHMCSIKLLDTNLLDSILCNTLIPYQNKINIFTPCFNYNSQEQPEFSTLMARVISRQFELWITFCLTCHLKVKPQNNAGGSICKLGILTSQKNACQNITVYTYGHTWKRQVRGPHINTISTICWWQVTG